MQTPGGLRSELGFRIAGYVVMPEQFHLLLWPSADANPSQILQNLEGRTALFVLKNLKENTMHPWRRRMLDEVRLPATVHRHAHFRVWQRRGYGLNVSSSKKIDEKQDYLHSNPIVLKLVDEHGNWSWSSWRFYFLEDAWLIAMDRVE